MDTWYIYISSRLNWTVEHKVIKICFHSTPSSFERKMFLKQVYIVMGCCTMYHNGHNNQFGSSTTTIISFINLSKSFLLRVGCVVIILDPTRKLGRRQKKWAIFWKKKKAIKKLLSGAKQTLSPFLHLIPRKYWAQSPQYRKVSREHRSFNPQESLLYYCSQSYELDTFLETFFS